MWELRCDNGREVYVWDRKRSEAVIRLSHAFWSRYEPGKRWFVVFTSEEVVA